MIFQTAGWLIPPVLAVFLTPFLSVGVLLEVNHTNNNYFATLSTTNRYCCSNNLSLISRWNSLELLDADLWTHWPFSYGCASSMEQVKRLFFFPISPASPPLPSWSSTAGSPPPQRLLSQSGFSSSWKRTSFIDNTNVFSEDVTQLRHINFHWNKISQTCRHKDCCCEVKLSSLLLH